MFADSFCEVSWKQRSGRRWSTLASFSLQALVVATLLTIPLVYTEGLPPLQRLAESMVFAPPPGPPPAPSDPSTPKPTTSNVASDGSVIAPQSVPDKIADITEGRPPDPVDMGGLGHQGVLGGTGRYGFGVLGGDPLSEARPPEPAKPAAQPPRVSVMMEGNLVHRVQPVYPHMAIISHVQGTVLLQATISREGRIENMRLISGHPMLVEAAVDAVRQWRYRPYFLNGAPVEVETQVTVNFVLSGN